MGKPLQEPRRRFGSHGNREFIGETQLGDRIYLLEAEQIWATCIAVGTFLGLNPIYLYTHDTRASDCNILSGIKFTLRNKDISGAQ